MGQGALVALIFSLPVLGGLMGMLMARRARRRELEEYGTQEQREALTELTRLSQEWGGYDLEDAEATPVDDGRGGQDGARDGRLPN